LLPWSCFLLVTYSHHLLLHNLLIHHMFVPRSLACQMLRYSLNMLFLAHCLLIACFFSRLFFLHGTTSLTCVGSKVRNKEANYSSSHLPLKFFFFLIPFVINVFYFLFSFCNCLFFFSFVAIFLFPFVTFFAFF
jgi:hypothetical protein